MSRPFDRISFAEVRFVRDNLETKAPRQLQRERISSDHGHLRLMRPRAQCSKHILQHRLRQGEPSGTIENRRQALFRRLKTFHWN